MDETLRQLNDLMNKRDWTHSDRQLIIHSILCIYNTVKELADGERAVSVQSKVQSTKRRSSNKK